MTDPNEELAEAREQVQGIKTLLGEEIPHLFEFDVVVGNVNYSDTKNRPSLTVEPSSDARNQLPERFGGANAQIDGQFESEFGFTSEPSGE